MKRTLAIVALAALLTQAVAAQDSPDPSIQSVLDAARAKRFAEQIAEAAERAAEAAVEAAERVAESPRHGKEEKAPFTPFLLSFAPGLSIPFGTYDAAFSFGVIGTLSRDVLGFQASNVFNIARKVSGFQGAGVFNISEGSVDGFQGAGVFNISEDSVDGFQGAGVFNISEGSVSGFQGAGVFNIAGDADLPIQAAGVFNIAENINGMQLAGIFNSAASVKGGQIASIVNIASDVQGIQLGLVNIADRVDGMQLGLVNIVREPGLSSEGGFYEPDTDYVYAAFQAGSKHLYSVFAAGIPREDWNRSAEGLVLSYGLGSRLRLSAAYLDIDISAASFFGPELPAIGHAMEMGKPMMDASGLIPYPSLRLCLGVPLIGRFTLVGGVKADVDLDAAPRVPEALKRGNSWSSELGGLGFTAWTKWYFGVKI